MPGSNDLFVILSFCCHLTLGEKSLYNLPASKDPHPKPALKMTSLDSVLYDYQKKCLRWMAKRERAKEAPGGVLCLDMGLGKTILTMAVMAENPMKTLIVVPTSLVAQWVSEFEKFTNHSPMVIDTTTSNKGLITKELLDTNPVIVMPITAFSAMSNNDDNLLLTYNFGRIVVDEAHLIRNKRTKSYRLICQMDAEVKWCLTGTPIVKDDNNFSTLLEFIGIFKTNLVYAAKEFLYRVVKEDVFDLPKLVIEDLRGDFQTDVEKNAYEDIMFQGSIALKAYRAYGDSEGRMEMLKTLLRLRQCTANVTMVPKNDFKGEFYEGTSTKLKMLEDDIKASPIQKTLIFAHFHKEMAAIKDMLLSNGHKSVAINGNVSEDDRVKAIKQFNEDSATNFFIIQIAAGGIGLNLQTASRIYINGVDWNGTSETQAIARAHRIGQTKPVIVKRLIINDTIDDAIIGLQQKKFGAASEILGDERIKNSLNAQKNTSTFKSLLESIFKSS
ncbi:ATP-dependent helicase [Paramecium bursaria Chlorella virus CVB-1]|nr:ATP-dependent helicase [Paramecium bursaria Chlorella virus CVB-1]